MVSPRPEIHSLTSLRGYLALWVVLYHYWPRHLLLFPSADTLTPICNTGMFAVPGFFILSGFVLTYNYADRFQTLKAREVFRFYVLRLARVYPVHFATLMVVLAMVLVARYRGMPLHAIGYSPGQFVLHLFLVQTWVPDFQLSWNYPSWSISSEWFAYLFFPFACQAASRWLQTTMRAAVATVALTVASVYLLHDWRGREFYELVMVIPTFLAGCTGYWLVRNRFLAAATSLWTTLPEVIVIGMVIACYTLAQIQLEAALITGSLLLILSLACCGDRASRLWVSAPAVFLGEVSYSLYMTHTIALKVVNAVLPAERYASSSVVVKAGLLGLDVLMVAGACLASYYLVERPCRELVKQRLARKPPLMGRIVGKG